MVEFVGARMVEKRDFATEEGVEVGMEVEEFVGDAAGSEYPDVMAAKIFDKVVIVAADEFRSNAGPVSGSSERPKLAASRIALELPDSGH